MLNEKLAHFGSAILQIENPYKILVQIKVQHKDGSAKNLLLDDTKGRGIFLHLYTVKILS